MFFTTLVILLAIFLDLILGEPKKYHPLVGFGNLANTIEKKLNGEKIRPFTKKLAGIFSWFILVIPIPAIYFIFYSESYLFIILDSVILYLAIGFKSLRQHAMNIYKPLKEEKLERARSSVAMMVSRKTETLDEKQIARATTESVLENGHDAVIASLFWYLVGGIPLVIIHRLANTLDAMWGYKNVRFLSFGWFAARADDFLGFPSAILTAVLYIISGLYQTSFHSIKKALRSTYRQAQQYKSLNGGWTIASGAYTLNIKLGGDAEYDGHVIHSPSLGFGREVEVVDIKRSLNLLDRAVIVLVTSLLFLGLLIEGVIR